MKLAATGSSVMGPAHKQDNLPNQDAVMIHRIQRGWCVAVCDGLGSKSRSHIGSKKAAQQVWKTLRQSSSGVNTTPEQISQKIQKSWQEELGENIRSYATTCLWAHIEPNGKGRAAQVGDGLLLVKTSGVFKVITPVRNGFCNETQTLAGAETTDWTTAVFEFFQSGDGVLLMTDGISDDLIPDQLEEFFDVVYRQLKNTNKRRCKRWLSKELEEWSTPKHGDDKSIAGIFRIE